MVVDFPVVDHNQYEKILMYYNMRCKGGLISDGAYRNRGCGEWDFSCNTFITDSSRIDSVAAFAPYYIIPCFSMSEFEYSVQPTFTYYESQLKSVNYLVTNSEIEFPIAIGNDEITLPIGGIQQIVKVNLFIWDQIYLRLDLRPD